MHSYGFRVRVRVRLRARLGLGLGISLIQHYGHVVGTGEQNMQGRENTAQGTRMMR